MKNLSEIQVDTEALRHNLRSLRCLAPEGVRVAAVVKGNAYGHGLETVVSALDGSVDAFQIDDVEELRRLRTFSDRPALVLGYVLETQLEDAHALDCELAIYDAERLPVLQRLAERTGKRPRLHLKIDALLGRQGVVPRDLDAFLAELRQYDGLDLVAAYAHFANIEDTTDLSHAWAQVETFEDVFRRLREGGWPDLGRHVSATSGVMTVEANVGTNDLVRLGLGVYGMYPSTALSRTHRTMGLRPAIRWVSHLAQVKTLPARHPVGYGLTFVTPREMRIGIVPQGYSDGYDRHLSSAGEVLVGGQRCPVLGRIAMNMFAIDLSEVPEAKAEDEVVLLGKQGGEHIHAEELAQLTGTINYEITTRICPLLPRVAA